MTAWHNDEPDIINVEAVYYAKLNYVPVIEITTYTDHEWDTYVDDVADVWPPDVDWN